MRARPLYTESGIGRGNKAKLWRKRSIAGGCEFRGGSFDFDEVDCVKQMAERRA